ncbi:MAG: DUF2878 domain-containing protein [Pseudomonadales bacterium]
MLKIILNGALFNLGWLACVVLRNYWSLLAVLAVIALYLVMEERHLRQRGAIVVAVAVLVGFAIDNAMLSEGLLIPVGAEQGGFAPFWMTCLWAILATTFNIAFKPLQNKLVLAGVMGAISAPLTYLGAVRLGAAEFGVPAEFALAGLAVVWLLVFPAGLLFTRRLMSRATIA